jgi:ribosomal protein S18 acetylase RimI-like enzyme
MAELRIVDVLDEQTFGLIPPCAYPRFDHRTCDYWEDAERGAKDARPTWLVAPKAAPEPPRPPSDNPFAPSAPGGDRRRDALAALLGDDADDLPGAPGLTADDRGEDTGWNPFASTAASTSRTGAGLPRKLGLLTRGTRVFGSYARVALVDDRPVAYAQFGPLSAYPRAQRLRDLYPQLPAAPLPAVISCIATTAEARGQGHATRLVEDVCGELGRRGFAAVEAYPDLTLPEDATSAAHPAFWLRCGFALAVDDDRFPVFRRELG